jgi:hypothetical protein
MATRLHTMPRLGLFAGLHRILFGDRAKRAQVSDHGAFMRTVGRAWAIPMTLVFSLGALITLGQSQIGELVREFQAHQPLNYVTLALLAITFVIVGGMDLTLLNSAVELRDARLRGVDPKSDPYTKGAQLRVWLVSFIESATFASVAAQLDHPPSFAVDPGAAAVSWGFILGRALVAPVCAMYLATLGKRHLVRREMYGNLLLTIGGTIQQILENLQFAADERLIEPLWRMQVQVDRASRATTDTEMDALDDELLKALGQLRHLRDQLSGGLSATLHVPSPSPEEGDALDEPVPGAKRRTWEEMDALRAQMVRDGFPLPELTDAENDRVRRSLFDGRRRPQLQASLGMSERELDAALEKVS